MKIDGTSSNDELDAQKDEQIFGMEGDDILDSSNGQGNNLLDGGSGKDKLFGNHNDTLRGGAGEDSLYALGILGFNTLEGGEDSDRLFIVEGSNNTLDGGSGNDELVVIEGGYNTLRGGTANDVLNASSGTANNLVYGDEGDDILIGGVASDSLFGGAGDDLLFAGKKGSTLTGGTGGDRFYIASAAVPEMPVEVLDFTKGHDKVVIAAIPEVREFQDLKLEQIGLDTSIKVKINGEFKEFGILRNVQANTLTPDDFDFIFSIFSITNASAIEGNVVTFTISRTGDISADQNITVATSLGAGDTAGESDFTAKTETITFKQGESEKTFTVQTTQDVLFEEDETFSVNLSNPTTNASIISPTSGIAQGTINNDDSAPIFAISSASAAEGNAITFTITRTGDVLADQNVTVATSLGQGDTASESDFTAKTETLTFKQGETQKTFRVETISDSLLEDNEIFNVNLLNPTNGGIVSPNGTAKGTITNDDIPLAKNVDNDIFTIKSNSDKARLKVTLTGHNSNFANELGVFIVDDATGNINGIKPGASGYAQVALERAKVIFSTIINVPNGFNTNNLTSLLEFNSADRLRFYLVKNSTTDSVRTGVTPIADVLFADASTQKITDLGADEFSVAWKDGLSTSTADFKNLVVKIQSTNEPLPLGTNLQSQPQGELIDLRNVTQQIKADFFVNRESAFNNFVGFYRVTDENGGIDTNDDGKADVLIGQAGYTQAAVRGRVSGIDLTVNNQGTAAYTGTFQPGSIFAPFIIIDGRPDAILDNNSNNNPAVYFPFLGANSDKVDHIRLLGNNIFGFEDLTNGGDKDYNDVIVRVNLSIA
jgi:Domain of unknown function (DUF4114)/Calx-beta domain/RTX calcium-binding nonapeptide repeat (4 copies)